jgi:hypothetical protein
VSVKGYLEYLELHSYFARVGEPKLSRAEYDVLDAEYVALAANNAMLDDSARTRLREVKAILFRDKP